MDYARTTYVEFLYPGMLFSESSVKKVKNRDVSKLKVPRYSYGFIFFDILSVTVKAGGKKVELTSDRLRVSPMHYYDAKVYTLAEIKRTFPKERVLINNFEGGRKKKAVRCRTGNWQIFERTDVLVKAA